MQVVVVLFFRIIALKTRIVQFTKKTIALRDHFYS